MKRPHRRAVLGAIGSLPAFGLIAPARAQPSLAAARAFIQDAGNQLVAIVNGPGSAAQKAQALEDLVNRVVAVDLVADYVLGRFRSVATADQHERFMALFHQLLSYNITYQIRAYQGVSFTINDSAPSGDDIIVDTTVARPDQAPADVGWVVEAVAGALKIVDVIVAGTSLRITTRNDYASVIINNGGQFQALLDAMQSQIDRIKSGE